MGEKIILNDPTGIEDTAKQESLHFILSNIDNMLLHGQQGSIVDKIVRDLSLKDIDDYLKKLITNQDLSSEIPLLTSFSVDNRKLFNDLCKHTNVYEMEYSKHKSQKIYFIESADFAITLIPIELEDNKINIYMEPLDDSPGFIQKIWANRKETKGISNIEFVDYRTLSPNNKG